MCDHIIVSNSQPYIMHYIVCMVSGKPEAQIALDDVMHDLENKTYLFEESEKLAVRSALVEERTRFCVFISCLKPVMVRPFTECLTLPA